MATYKTATLELKEDTFLVSLDKVPPNSFFVIVSDNKGSKKILSLDTSTIQPNQAVLQNTLTGMCLKFINGTWQWVPC